MTAEVEKPQTVEATPAEDLASKEDPSKIFLVFHKKATEDDV